MRPCFVNRLDCRLERIYSKQPLLLQQTVGREEKYEPLYALLSDNVSGTQTSRMANE